jgi:primosomal protein N' (replication factor Y) (superfamily II helicase)
MSVFDSGARSSQPSLFSDAADAVSSADSLPSAAGAIARVTIEETALELDYAVPPELSHRVRLGTRVHVPLQGRRPVGWCSNCFPKRPFMARSNQCM